MTRMLILWNAAEQTSKYPGEDPRVPELRSSTVSRLEALGYDVTTTEDLATLSDRISDAEVFYGKQLTPEGFAGAGNLKWIQTSVAGMEGFWQLELIHQHF